ncbi:methyltransferase [Kineococcus sp. R8]|uniref:class I SAM-dependent methyltransferase n=1 Tax=Kineococcus siccus TaxID=2696567 RepID=UPI0014122545|nr:class I SAM-dependent methyltransferase [Kineococcus siccus]NAZ83247.1 methyltransferase [Kineococcus siccus]
MRQHGHDHGPHHDDRTQTDHGAGDHREFLDLDAEVFGAQLGAALDLAGVPAPRHVVDLGAGSGTGSRLLRARHPGATLTCVDNDREMLHALRQHGFATLEADLDEGFPELGAAAGPPDLVWAASSLHHVTRPAPLLAGVRSALAPGGTLVVVELAGLPRFLADSACAAVEERCHAAAAAEGWNHHPDWTPVIEGAGFTVQRTELSTPAPVTPAARRYAREWLTRFATLGALTAADRAAVTDLLPLLAADLPLSPRADRTVWVATPR